MERLKVEADQAANDKQRDMEEAVKKVIRDYRLFTDCFYQKDEYASCYLKFSFYHNRTFLEARWSHESFEDIVFANAISFVPPQDWRRY